MNARYELPERALLVRTMAANAFLLSLLYLGLGVVLEVLRRVAELRWAARLLLAMDALPARALEAAGLLTPLREAYLAGGVRDWVLRAVFSAAALGVIFTTAAVVGVLMACLGALLRRRAAP